MHKSNLESIPARSSSESVSLRRSGSSWESITSLSSIISLTSIYPFTSIIIPVILSSPPLSPITLSSIWITNIITCKLTDAMYLYLTVMKGIPLLCSTQHWYVAKHVQTNHYTQPSHCQNLTPKLVCFQKKLLILSFLFVLFHSQHSWGL